MMALGLLLHGAASYRVRVPARWHFDDPSASVLCDWLVAFIHMFRMPAFFVMAGFFGALLLERRGVRGLVMDRLRRVGLVFVLAWPLVLATLGTGAAFAQARLTQGYGAAFESAFAVLRSGAWLRPSTVHLWFLYQLLLFYAAALVLVSVGRRLPSATQRLRRAFRRAIDSPLRVVWFAIPTAGLLLPMRSLAFDTDASLLPAPRVLVAYFFVFGVGWLLYAERERLPQLAARVWTNLALGSVATVAWVVVVVRILGGGFPGARAVAVLLCGLATWHLVFGLTGLFLRHAASQSRRRRWLSDASYWIYLVHLPLLVWLAGVLAPWRAPALLKLGAVLAVATPTVLLTYRVLVRPTAIGVLLNGRRYRD